MIRSIVDRVMEASTTTGTGTYTLGGAITGYRTFSVVGTGGQCYYCAVDVDVNGVPIGDWEVGLGTYTASGTTLARTRVDESSNSGGAVNWSAGTRRIFICHPARVGVPVNGWTVRNAIVWNSYLAPELISARVKDNASVNWRLLTQSLGGASAYTFTATVRAFLAAAPSGTFGIYLYDGTKLIGFEILGQRAVDGGVFRLRVQRMDSVTVDNATVAGPTIDLVPYVVSLRIVKDASHRTFYYFENNTWVQFYQEAASAFLTETDIGFGGLSVYGSALDSFILVDLLQFSVTTP
jgi:hypothetical protein